jgi:hypothetical protein
MVQSRVNAGFILTEENHDTLEKIEDPYSLYDEYKLEVPHTNDKEKSIQEIVQEEKANIKKSHRSIWQMTKDSRASLSFYRLGAYSMLILGFFYLNNSHKLDITSYLFSLSLPPIIVIITLIRKIR